MRLRWNFHRLMLAQSMSFYQDEFAGRIATKVMQTALAVRDTWMILADILVYVVIYFVTMVAVVGSFDLLAAGAVPGLAGAVRGGCGTSCRAWPVAQSRPTRAR
jgi:ATP-binding cassette, subfamily B, multidrug efflux pump